eukprot:CAMPEP_0181499638 /NCGR_PEP_ID=MMETSP1110-20121109/54770_1 /TAXON_ID=174948 /ORGANISM="Symbiodinium sp., Strain CCMP421" /LENGTH=237 /DNA_ID=CAMNT_0023627847 /DNA_START=20 /DNA_END=730 /DNA_ORIENTATION=-
MATQMRVRSRSKGTTLQETSPLSAVQMPGFPQPKPLPERLSRLGSCVHVPALGSSAEDAQLAKSLLTDIQKVGKQLRLHRSRRHLQIWGEHLTSSKTFTAVVSRLLSLFGLKLVDCWVNVYRSGEEEKSPHHDNYQDRSPSPTATIGLSLGSTRDIVFRDRYSGETFPIPQQNGDVFAFDSSFNRLFTHAIPPSEDDDTGLRLSIIVWAMESDGHTLAVPQAVRQGRGFPTKEVVSW